MRRITTLVVVVCVAMSLPPMLARARQAGARARLRHTVAEGIAARWSPDNKTLAVATYGKGLVLYDAAEGKARVELKLARQVLGPEAIAFTPDGRTLIVHTDRVSLYDAADGRLLREFAEKTEPINLYEKYYKPTERETSEKDEATGLNRKETVNPSDGEELEELPMRNLSDRVVSPDGKSLLVRAREEGRAQVYDLSTGALKFTLEPVADTPRRKFNKGFGDAQGEFSPDGRLILTTHRNHTPRLWDAATGAHVADLAPQPGTVVGARFSRDGKFVATTTFLNESGVVKIWEAATGKLRHTTGTPKDRHYFAAWNPSDNTFVVKTLKWEIKIFDAETGALVARLDDKAIKEKFYSNLTFVYSPDGRVLVTQAYHKPSFLFNLGVKKGKPRLIAHLWDARTGAHLVSLRDTEPRGAHAYVYDKYFWSPSGDFLVTAGASVKLWNRRGELLQELDGNALLHAGLSRDGKLLALINGSPALVNWTVLSDVADTAKILVGKLPKDNTPRAHVWQIESN